MNSGCQLCQLNLSQDLSSPLSQGSLCGAIPYSSRLQEVPSIKGDEEGEQNGPKEGGPVK